MPFSSSLTIKDKILSIWKWTPSLSSSGDQAHVDSSHPIWGAFLRQPTHPGPIATNTAIKRSPPLFWCTKYCNAPTFLEHSYFILLWKKDAEFVTTWYNLYIFTKYMCIIISIYLSTWSVFRMNRQENLLEKKKLFHVK